MAMNRVLHLVCKQHCLLTSANQYLRLIDWLRAAVLWHEERTQKLERKQGEGFEIIMRAKMTMINNNNCFQERNDFLETRSFRGVRRLLIDIDVTGVFFKCLVASPQINNSTRFGNSTQINTLLLIPNHLAGSANEFDSYRSFAKKGI